MTWPSTFLKTCRSETARTITVIPCRNATVQTYKAAAGHGLSGQSLRANKMLLDGDANLDNTSTSGFELSRSGHGKNTQMLMGLNCSSQIQRIAYWGRQSGLTSLHSSFEALLSVNAGNIQLSTGREKQHAIATCCSLGPAVFKHIHSRVENLAPCQCSEHISVLPVACKCKMLHSFMGPTRSQVRSR